MINEDNIKEIIAIGDVHGLDLWKKVVERHRGAHIVFMGDYCDPYGESVHEALLDNLKEIIDLKRSEPVRITLLLGNHDLHYFNSAIPRGSRFDAAIAQELRFIFKSEKSLFCNAWQYRNILFTHAGVSQYWIDTGLCHDIMPDAARCLNNPELLGENPGAIYDCGRYRGGDSHFSGIFWADIEELNKLPKGLIQVAGHNRVGEIKHIRSCNAKNGENADLYACDCLYNNIYLRITIDEDGINFYQKTLDDMNVNLRIVEKNRHEPRWL